MARSIQEISDVGSFVTRPAIPQQSPNAGADDIGVVFTQNGKEFDPEATRHLGRKEKLLRFAVLASPFVVTVAALATIKFGGPLWAFLYHHYYMIHPLPPSTIPSNPPPPVRGPR